MAIERDDGESDPINHLLRNYEKTLDVLKREDRLQEQASTTFAELAAKVKAEVDRRSGIDRRAHARASERRAVRTREQLSETAESAQ
jgi:hypothetical protein